MAVSNDVPCNSLGNLIFGHYAIDSAGDATQAGGTDVAVQVNFGIPVADWQDQGLQAIATHSSP